MSEVPYKCPKCYESRYYYVRIDGELKWFCRCEYQEYKKSLESKPADKIVKKKK